MDSVITSLLEAAGIEIIEKTEVEGYPMYRFSSEFSLTAAWRTLRRELQWPDDYGVRPALRLVPASDSALALTML